MDNFGNTAKEPLLSTGAPDDGSRMWTLYNSEAEKVDKALVENWKGDMDGILIFAGLFSAVVTAFIIESYKNLKQDPTDTTVALLVQVSQLLVAISNGTHASIPSPSPDQIPFQATISAVVVNVLWFLSLAFALACALAATLVQLWARNYLDLIGRRQIPLIRGRVRAYLFEGIESFQMVAIVDIIPVLLHIALLLFLVGLVVFFFPIHIGVASVTIVILIVGLILYLTITVLPVIYHNCPYQTHLSTALWRIVQVMGLLRDADSDRISGSMADGRIYSATKEDEDEAATHSRDVKAVQWTMAMTDDTELEPFVSAIPGFFGRINPAQASSALEVLVTDGLVGRIWMLGDSWRSQPQFKPQLALTCMKAIEVLTDHATLPLWSRMDYEAHLMCSYLSEWANHKNSIIHHYALRVRLSAYFSLLNRLFDDLFLTSPDEEHVVLQDLRAIRAEVPEAAWRYLPSRGEYSIDILLGSLSEQDRRRTVEVMKGERVSKFVADNVRWMKNVPKHAMYFNEALCVLAVFDRDTYEHILEAIGWVRNARFGLVWGAGWVEKLNGGSNIIDNYSILVIMHMLPTRGSSGVWRGARLLAVHSLVNRLLERPPMTAEDIEIIRSTLYRWIHEDRKPIGPTDSSDTEIQQKFVDSLREAVGPVPSGTTKLPPVIIDALLPIIQSFEHLPAVESAISVVSDYLKLQPESWEAQRALVVLQGERVRQRRRQRIAHTAEVFRNLRKLHGPGIGNSIDDATNDTLGQKAPSGAPNPGSSSNEPASGGSIEGGAHVLTEQNAASSASPARPPTQDTDHLAGSGSFQDTIRDSSEQTSPPIASSSGESLNGVVRLVSSVVEELAPVPEHSLNPPSPPSIVQTADDPPKELGDVVEGSIRHHGPDLYHSSC